MQNYSKMKFKLNKILHLSGNKASIYSVTIDDSDKSLFSLGDGIVALYDEPQKNLRLYCIKYGNQIIILGGGGFKGENIKALQDDTKLKHENYLLRKISKHITKKMNDEIFFSADGSDFYGNLEFDMEEL